MSHSTSRHSTSRHAERGFTFVELLVALVIMTAVSGTLYALLTGQQRAARAQTETLAMYGVIRGGSQLLPEELREINVPSAGTSDLVSIAPTALRYRAMRGLGFICQITPTEVRLANNGGGERWMGNPPRAGIDSLFVYVDRDPNVGSDDIWARARITGVNASSTCGGSVAIALTVPEIVAGAGVGVAVPMADISLGSPARTFEDMSLSLGTQNGQNWLMAASVSAADTPTPVVGPLTANGVTFAGFDANGNATTDQLLVRTIQVTLRGITDRKVRTARTGNTPNFVQDSVITAVSLRNVPRN